MPNDIVVHDSASNTQMAVTAETASTAVAAQAKALVEARYTVAIRRPRDLDAVRQAMMKECKRPSFAAVARYNKPVGKGIQGPSIRFAEMAIRCMTNITVETMTVYDDREKRIVRVSVTDLEANVPYSLDVTIEKTIERKKIKDGDVVIRSRTNSYGDTVHLLEAGEDDILNKQNALISKAIRTQGLRLVPGDLIDEGQQICRETMQNQDRADPDTAKKRLFDAFDDIGVRIEQIKAFLGHDGGNLSPKELADLRGFYAAIKEGETTWAAVMESAKTGEVKPAATRKTKLADAVQTPVEETNSITYKDVHDALVASSDEDALNSAWDMKNLIPKADKEQEGSLAELYSQRLEELTK